MTKAINIKDLDCSYGKVSVLKDISFSVSIGDLFIIIGPNGSGKTTLMKTIAGLRRFENGRIDILDRPTIKYSGRSLAQVLAFVPQEVSADFPFSVTELVLMGRSPYLGILGFPQKEDFEIANQALVFTGADHLAHRKLDHLSGGERQLVFIARAICQEPQVILLDEPTAALDLAHQVKIMDMMEKLKTEKDITVVMVSHDLNLAAMYADALLLLNDGKVVGRGTTEEVLTYKVLEKAYGCRLLVDKSPLGNFPRVTPAPGKLVDICNSLNEQR